jgi:hypothetical protein
MEAILKKLILAVSTLGLILILAAEANAGQLGAGQHGTGQQHGRSLSASPHSTAIIAVQGPQHRHARHMQQHKSRYGYGNRTGYGNRHGYGNRYGYGTRHGYRHYQPRPLPARHIVRALHRQHYHSVSRIVLKHDHYKVRARDFRGRSVKLLVNAQNGRILHIRFH